MRRAKSTGPKGDPATWGNLSTDLAGPVDPALCQSCGDKSYSLWREHGDRDQPTNTYLWLCVRCSNQLIEPHARLYSRVDENDPRPGAMGICSDCGARDRLTCTSPDLQSKGGKGVAITIEPAIRVHLQMSPRSQSGNRMLYMRPATGCGSKCTRPNPIPGISTNGCHAQRDGDCIWLACPQNRENEPASTGRHCPLDTGDDGYE